MGLNLGKILDAVTDIIPLGSTAKSLLKGAGSLLFKKAAKTVGIKEDVINSIFVEADKIAEYDHEIKIALLKEEEQKRVHELAVFGRFAELDTGSQKLRARIRPLLSLGLIGTFILICFVFLIQQVFPRAFGLEFMIVFPPELVSISKVVVGFWFGGRTIEKAIDIFKNGK